jgi:hypothetical protein
MAYCEITGGKVSVKVEGTKHTMICTECDKKLGTLLESDKKSRIFNRTTKYQCICICGGESFVVRSLNECYFIPEANLMIKEMPIDTMKREYIENKIIMGEV